MFQSTHPHGVRLFLCGRQALATMFQSTHPHGVRRAYVLGKVRLVVVSIHAPAWGATSLPFLLHLVLLFQSTHPHGVRPVLMLFAHCKDKFQSTHPHGVRLDCTIGSRPQCVFQSTHPHGVRRAHNIYFDTSMLFQSTHPHGVRPGNSTTGIPRHCFNPRTRMGCDQLILLTQTAEQ